MVSPVPVSTYLGMFARKFQVAKSMNYLFVVCITAHKMLQCSAATVVAKRRCALAFNTKSLYFSMNSGSVKIEYPNFFLLAFLGISSRLDFVEWILARAHFWSSSSSQSVKKGHVWRPFWRWVRGGIFFIFGLEVTYVQYFEEMKWKKSALFFLQRYEPISFGHFSL